MINLTPPVAAGIMKAWQGSKHGMGSVCKKKGERKIIGARMFWIISRVRQMRIHRHRVKVEIKRDLIMFL